MSFVIFETGGKQYRVSAGDTVRIESLPEQVGETVTFPYVVLSSDETHVELGTPFLEGASVEAMILDEGRGEKIRVVKKNAKKRYHKVQGHRQNYTEVKIVKI
ncbi:MAG: 50S ribosomal protein L21 [Candidatus Peregrinibacteria bacterium]